MDYGDVARYDLEYKAFKLLIPKARSSWVDNIQYDNKGIAPDVRIPIEVSDWLEFVIEKENLR
jgi:hypothetical protein